MRVHGLRVLPLLLALIAGSAAVHAQREAEPDAFQLARRARALGREIMSPFCPGRTLVDCPSPDAASLRAEIRAQMAAGVREEEIRAQLEARFGDVIRSTPRGIWGWTLPGLGLLAGLGVVVSFLRRSAGVPREEPAPLDPLLEEELDRELRRRGL